jgi:hypothetical protein
VSEIKGENAMAKTFGNFIEMGDSQEYLIISFSSSRLSIQDRWRNNSLSADFLANYWGSFFPLYPDDPKQRRAEVQDTVSYIANELLENAIKFGSEPEQIPVKIGIYLSKDMLRFYVTNSLDPAVVPIFQKYIQELLREDPGELYVRQIERNASEEGSTESRLGFLTLLNDYEAKLSWKFDIVPNELGHDCHVVTTMVELDIVRAAHSQPLPTR